MYPSDLSDFLMSGQKDSLPYYSTFDEQEARSDCSEHSTESSPRSPDSKVIDAEEEENLKPVFYSFLTVLILAVVLTFGLFAYAGWICGTSQIPATVLFSLSRRDGIPAGSDLPEMVTNMPNSDFAIKDYGVPDVDIESADEPSFGDEDNAPEDDTLSADDDEFPDEDDADLESNNDTPSPQARAYGKGLRGVAGSGNEEPI
ncbi:hypothetical protein N7466_005972 [Penicillium verhagenii]|uniref:uncharacterized protein n=1 Tax=Penicillium verhagenii TaxID=1562060 RepID=UPI0025450A32|nr:uncharacterized protein N7466_005972 [Penicillium verhagenii]KAJ5930479.1 hypothetical protein N7466_005972 [Penicillium verhagenii]